MVKTMFTVWPTKSTSGRARRREPKLKFVFTVRTMLSL